MNAILREIKCFLFHRKRWAEWRPFETVMGAYCRDCEHVWPGLRVKP